MENNNNGNEFLNKLYKELYLEYKHDKKSKPSIRIEKYLDRLKN